ncbi:Copper homeostasis protein cutC [Teratosphaeria destructans]|uniref:Copper homeostasis protein cutC homolog n=1 Tax=Teratosphaeria destructans TaxID=418781 RepID=A0A9W7T182_9PEZI|nr:Copper homeostasis protein cutC [Teratosphaeria destructans]
MAPESTPDLLFKVPIDQTGNIVCTRPQDKIYLLTWTSPPDNRLRTDFCQALLLALDIVEQRYPPGVLITTSGISKFYSNGLDLEHATYTPHFFTESLPWMPKEGVVDALGGLPETLSFVDELKLVAKAQPGMSGRSVYSELKREMYRQSLQLLEGFADEDGREFARIAAEKRDREAGERRIREWEGRTKAKLLELCENYDAGGISPNLEWLQQVQAEVTIPVYVMVRPRGGDFNYSADEFEQMRRSVEDFEPYADGYVFGILDVCGHVDVERTAELVRLARGKPCTFHRAFDETPDLFDALERVVEAGFQSAQGRIDIIVGGGVRSHNIGLLRTDTQARLFHSAAIDEGTPSEQEVASLKVAVQG